MFQHKEKERTFLAVVLLVVAIVCTCFLKFRVIVERNAEEGGQGSEQEPLSSHCHHRA